MQVIETRKRDNVPLDGITVLDLGQVYQGPYAGFLFAQAGATVLKIEPPAGEPVRRRSQVSKGAAVPFAMLNANKRAMTLDLKSEGARTVLKDLVRKADVLIENYAPGVMDRLGVGWEVLREINPRLVYGSATGFGLSGPDRDNLAMDLTIQAASGMMSVTGFPDGPPVKAGPAVADFLGGTHLYAGIVSALYERHFTGRGRLVEIAMQETIYPALASNLAFVFNHGAPSPRTGNRHGALAEAPYNVYPAKDGWVAIISITERHWAGLLNAIGRNDVGADARFASAAARAINLDATDALVSAWTVSRTKAEISEALRGYKVPFAPVRDLLEVVYDPHMHARGTLEWVDHPEYGRIVLPNSPLRIHGTDKVLRTSSPRLGEHNVEILRDLLGYDEDYIDRLKPSMEG